MSRLARNSKDWSDLFEVSAIFRTLIADEDGLFDPNDPNDRLVLGLTGIISEMERHTMKIRLERGRLNKAQRGELFHDVPVGYVKGDDGLPRFDPDISAQHAMKMFFELFESVGSSHGLFLRPATQSIKLLFRTRGGPIEWRLPAKTTVCELLKHLLYAGAYGYGKRKNYASKAAEKRGKKHLPPEQWKVLIRERFPVTSHGSSMNPISSECMRTMFVPIARGPHVMALHCSQGIIFCSECGRRMSPRPDRNQSRHRRVCHGRHSSLVEASGSQTLQSLATFAHYGRQWWPQ